MLRGLITLGGGNNMTDAIIGLFTIVLFSMGFSVFAVWLVSIAGIGKE